MKAYLAVAVGTVFVSVLCSVIVPDGKLKKTVTFSLRMVCIAALIQPVYSLFSYAVDESADDACDYSYICEAYSVWQEDAAERTILSEFGEECDCEILIEYVDGQFVQTSVSVTTVSGNFEIISEIYEYLEGLGYININVI